MYIASIYTVRAGAGSRAGISRHERSREVGNLRKAIGMVSGPGGLAAREDGMIRYALLGLLRERSDYGYSLRRRFEERLGPVWRLNSGQVYQSLRYLRRARLVDVVMADQVAEGTEPRERCVFAPTTKGERVLDRWLASAPHGAHGRDETLLRLAVLASTDPARASGLVEKRLRVLRKRVTLLQAKVPANSRNGTPAPIARLIAHEAALRHAEAHVSWLELASRVLGAASEADGEMAAAVEPALHGEWDEVRNPSA